MSKSSKSARLGDDKNYQRKVTNALQKPIIGGNLKQLHESSNFSTAGTTKQSNVASEKKFKSKLRSPSKSKTFHISPGTTQFNHSQSTLIKNADKRLSLVPLSNLKHYGAMKVNQDSGETIMAHQSKASRKEIKQNKTTKADDNVEKEKKTKMEAVVEQPALVTPNTNGKASETKLIQSEEAVQSPVVNAAKTTNDCIDTESCPQDSDDINNKITLITNDQNNLNGHKQNQPTETQSDEIAENAEFNEVIVVTESENTKEEHENKEKEKEVELSVQQEQLNLAENKEQTMKSQNEENASGSDLVGSTTSESSPVKDVENQIKRQDNIAQVKGDDDVSFISYDSNIMLKDVQIKLNDCLKDNSKLLDVTDPNTSTSDALKDLSFGRTLRGISGRNSLKRMRHITVREHLLTPNDSLFVNTSGTSLNDRSRYSELDVDSLYHNVSRRDRKRKLDDYHNESNKKSKTDESYGLFNTSLEYLRNLRKPVQVSTPNVRGYKFNIDKKTNDGDHEIITDEPIEPKKWCVVM